MATAGWADLYGWQVDRTNATPLFQQIYLQIRSAIVSRTLAPGLRLPSTRGLASRLQVARASVISAYEQLLAEGYIVGRARSGTFISSDLPASEPQVPRRGIAAQATRPSVAARFEAFERVRAFPAEADAVPFNMGRTRVDERTAATWRKLTTQAVRLLAEPDSPRLFRPAGSPGIAGAALRVFARRASGALRPRPDLRHDRHAVGDRSRHPDLARSRCRGLGRGPLLPGYVSGPRDGRSDDSSRAGRCAWNGCQRRHTQPPQGTRRVRDHCVVPSSVHDI